MIRVGLVLALGPLREFFLLLAMALAKMDRRIRL
jgi:hypothetical protein